MTVRNHCHLALTLGAFPEFAPIYKWTVIFPNYTPVPEKVIGLNRTLNGKLMKHRLQSGGITKKFRNYQLTIKVMAEYSYTVEERLEQLLAMDGESVYFTPLNHVGDGDDHTADTKTMFLSRMSPPQSDDPMMSRYYVAIELVDDFTVV